MPFLTLFLTPACYYFFLPDETLHPSWEAKRKQKVSLNSFQGKKITFDDGDNKNRGKPVQPRVQPNVPPTGKSFHVIVRRVFVGLFANENLG